MANASESSMNSDNLNFYAELIGKPLVSYLPGLGPIISSMAGDILAERKEKRIKEFLTSLDDALVKYADHVNENFVKQDDFYDILEQTLKKIVIERSTAKRAAYKNILLHGFISRDPSYDLIEYNLRLLDQLSNEHLLMLKLFKCPQNFDGTDTYDFKGSTLKRLFSTILPDWQYDVLYDVLFELENMRLIEKTSDNLMTMMSVVSYKNLDGRLTSKGMSFVQYILEQ